MIERKVILVSQLNDVLRVSAGLHSVAGIREHCCVDEAVQNALRGGKYPFHLVVYNAVVGDFIFRAFELIVPTFLHEDLLLFSDIRMEDGVHIYVHKVLEIRLIAARDRVHGLVRVGHRV